MAELKTQPNQEEVQAFLETIEDEKKRADAFEILQLMQEATGEEAVMWGDKIVGFGKYHYKYASGREGDWFLVGFSPRKQNLSVYIVAGFDEYEDLMSRLGKHKTGKSCLYIKRMADVDRDVLKELIRQSAEQVAKSNAD
jgi:hypothetical protein